MGVNNFSFCILLTRPNKHALSEFQLFTGSAPINPIVGLCAPHCFTLMPSSGLRDPSRDELAPLQNLEECGLPQSHLLLVTQKHEATEEFKVRRLPLP